MVAYIFELNCSFQHIETRCKRYRDGQPETHQRTSLATVTVLQSVTSRSREFPVPGISLLFGWYRYRYRKKLVPEKSTGTGTGKNWSRKKVPVPVPEKISPGKKYRSRYRKKLVPEKSTGPGTGKNSGYRHTLCHRLVYLTQRLLWRRGLVYLTQ